MSRSFNIANTMKELGNIISSGTKEIVLSGINIGDFGIQYNESLYELLIEIEALYDLNRYRISSIEPNLLTDEIIELIKQSKDPKEAKEKLTKKKWKLNESNINFIKLIEDKTNQLSKNFYTFTETQTKAILDLRLHKLTSLERDDINKELEKIDAQKNLVQTFDVPITKDLTNELMKNVDLVIVTGSQNNVKEAAKSGTPAIGVGQGNVTVIVDESANLKDAAQIGRAHV